MLSEMVSKLQLSTYPQIGLVCFMLIFAVVVRMTFKKDHAATWEHAKNIPLDEDRTP
jgi:hypothetical protein